MKLTPIFHHIPMKNVANALVLLKIEVISSLGRFSLMTPKRYLSGPLPAVPSTLLPRRDSLCHIGRDKRLTSHLILLCMTLPHLMKTLASCPPSILMNSWAEHSFLLLKRMGSADEHPLLNMLAISRIHKLHGKINYASTKKFKTRMILKTSFHTCRILGLNTLNSLLQYVNWLVWEVCSVN